MATETDAAPVPHKTESRQLNTASGSSDAAGTEPTTEEVAALAYQFWIERGSPHGSHEEDWYRAEAELRGRQPLVSNAGA